MPLELVIAFALAASLVAYLVAGGADFGGGVWDLFARGPRKQQQRDLIENAIGPIWEANHVWLILAIVLLFSGFPRAFAALSTAFYWPLTLFLVGIVFRGSAFVFRHALHDQPAPRKRWGVVFSLASIASPFLLGMVVAGVISTKWSGPFAFSVGAMTLSLCAFLAAVYLTRETNDAALRADFRSRATVAAAAVATFAIVTAALSPRFFRAWLLSRPESVIMIALTFAALAATVVLLRKERVNLARASAVAAAVMLIGGWLAAQYPYLLVPNHTVQNAAANPLTLKFMVGALVVGGALLFPSLYVMFRVFKGSKPFALRD